jgi:hypothetical protein
VMGCSVNPGSEYGDFKWISHRGNISGRNELRENHPEYIQQALDLGYDVEIDVWYVGKHWYLGHDIPQYQSVDIQQYTNDPRIWIHCKNLDAVVEIHTTWLNTAANYFFHVSDPITLTSQNWIWAFPRTKVNSKGAVCVMPEYAQWNKTDIDNIGFGGVCSDFIGDFK